MTEIDGSVQQPDNPTTPFREAVLLVADVSAALNRGLGENIPQGAEAHRVAPFLRQAYFIFDESANAEQNDPEYVELAHEQGMTDVTAEVTDEDRETFRQLRDVVGLAYAVAEAAPRALWQSVLLTTGGLLAAYANDVHQAHVELNLAYPEPTGEELAE